MCFCSFALRNKLPLPLLLIAIAPMVNASIWLLEEIQVEIGGLVC
jgi:hypothetical protein